MFVALMVAKMFPSCMPDQVGANQYHLECPNRDPNFCLYDSSGKKWCILHHPHHGLVIHNMLTDSSQNTVKADLYRSAVLSLNAKTNDLSLNHTEDNEIRIRTFPTESTSLLLTSVASESSLENNIQNVQQMYPKINVSRFRAIFKLSKD